MRVGLFGSAILLILTLIFSYIAIQNNKLAREVTIKEFGLDKNLSSKETNKTTHKEDKFNKDFSKELREFDKKFNSF